MANFIRSTVTDIDEWSLQKNRPVNIDLVEHISQNISNLVTTEKNSKLYKIEFKFASGDEISWRYTDEQLKERDFDYNYILYNKFRRS